VQLIKCTKKLLSELQKKPTSEASQANKLGSWHANIFHIERRKCVLVTNDITLYAMFIPYLTKPDFKRFDIVFGQNLFKNLLYENLLQSEIETALEEYKEIQYAKTDNRSIFSPTKYRYPIEMLKERLGNIT
jgi:hypothetical protein